MMGERSSTGALILALFGMGFATPSLGQTNGGSSAVIEEIVVTARLRSESLQEVPVTVNAFTAEEIEDAGIQRPNDYLSLVPNVTLVEAQNAGTTFLTIRGITQVRNNEPPVAVAIDGMLQTSPNQFNQALLDLQQIEVLKGPQGALYGRNAIGGAINITTKQPTDELQGRVQVGAGNGDHVQAQVSLSGPLAADRLYYRLNGTWLDRDGYIENVFRGDHVDYLRESSLQLRLDWLINDAWEADLRAYYSNTRGGSLNYNWQAFDYRLDAFTFRAPDANDAAGVIYEMNNRGENDRDILEVALKLDYQADWGTFTSITAHNQLEEWYGSDQAPYSESLTQYPFGPGIPFDGIAQQYWDVNALSQELRFASPGDRALRWLVGAYYVQTDRFISTPVLDDTGVGIVRIERAPTGPGQPTTFSFLADDNDNSAYALFGQLNYDVNDQVEASLALRYDEDRRVQIVSPHNTTGSQGARREATFDKLQPKITLRYLANSRVNLFASYSEGFRSGQFNQLGTSAAAQAAGIDGVFDVVGQEETKAVEVGLKAQIMGGRGKIDASLFNTRVNGQQYFLFFAPTSAQVLAGIDEVRLSGGEVEFSAFLLDRLDIYAGYGFTNSEIEDYSVEPAFIGNDAPYVPDHTINLGFQYRQPLTDRVGVLLRTDFERRGRQFWDPDNSSARNDVDIVNVRLGLEGERWQVIAWSKNLADELYLAEFVLGGFVHLAPPRSYGIDFTYTF
ncbi:MAG: TonB-dependent receptor [Gammaproteobacteria bacterium]|nr:TonB-dependent receptor [Gammaproteobacteria bacterium]MDE0414951.1 TonB-dependent receptor [Gammaproteobacteria bacterium]